MMKSVRRWILLCLIPSLSVHGQVLDTLADRFGAHIDENGLRRHLEVLASDAFEGRDTGAPGQKKAAQYIRDHFIACGIPPLQGGAFEGAVVDGYFQPFELIERSVGNIAISGEGTNLQFLRELFYFSEIMEGRKQVTELVFWGDGSGLYNAKKLKGDMVLIAEDGTTPLMVFIGQLRAQAEAAAQSGANMLFVATPRLQDFVDRMGHYISAKRMVLSMDEGPSGAGTKGIQVILVDEKAMDGLLGNASLGKLGGKKPGTRVPVRFTVSKADDRRVVSSENVLGYIEGTDKKDELIVITAHYDHVGTEDGQIYNGADDDGSGTVGIMMMAQAFSEAKAAGHGPRRSILIMPVSGEEKGLLGSRYYSENPIFPLELTVANLNIDMIGRVDSLHEDTAPYVYVIGSDRLSSELHTVNEEANSESVKLELDYTFNDRNDPNRFYFRSDHYNFARKGVPAIFYFSGVHEDYHQPSDTVDKIRFDLLRARTLLVFHTAWRLANREERIVVDGEID